MPKWDVSPQGTSGWLRARCGCLTASRMAEAMAFNKNGKEAEARAKLKIELLTERLTDMAVERYVNDAMRWGIETEPDAKAKYEEIKGVLIQDCGFALHDTIDFFGASPDGLLGDDGLIEIKCPTSTTHLKWLLDGVVPEQHKPQMLAQLLITGRSWCDFMSYDPRFTDEQAVLIRRFQPTAEELQDVEDAAMTFLAEVDQMFDKITRGE